MHDFAKENIAGSTGLHDTGSSVLPGTASWSHNNNNNVPLSQEHIHSYEDALKRIQEGTGINDINDINCILIRVVAITGIMPPIINANADQNAACRGLALN